MGIGRDQILGTDDHKYVEVEVPKWGGTVRLGSMTAAELLEYEAVASNGADRNVKILTMLVRAICNDKGERLFTDADIPVLARKDFTVLLDLFKAAAELNTATEKAAEKIQGE